MGKNNMKNPPASVQRVRDSLKSLNISSDVVELPDSTRTAVEAADAVGCQVGQIVKSLVFVGNVSQEAVLILTSGSNQVNEKNVGEILGEMIKLASADIVREETGFAIGSVSPFGLKQELNIFIDEDLLNYEFIWAAAGSHHAVFKIEPQILVKSTNGTIIKVT
jgi:prolyl-tRNA editing enzyme YbaK/EbsC (Cys-tRNA(Pro) deacylase)